MKGLPARTILFRSLTACQWTRFIAASILVGTSSVCTAESIMLAWDPNFELDIAGYRVHFGSLSGNYTQTINAGNATTVVVPDLDTRSAYFFAVTAYNTAGLESSFSEELPISTSISEIQRLPDGSFKLTLSGEPGLVNDVYVSNDMIDWTLLISVENGPGTVTIIDPGEGLQGPRFYRLNIQ